MVSPSRTVMTVPAGTSVPDSRSWLKTSTVLVFSQELEAGTEVPAGTVITVRLGDTTVRD